MFVIVVGGGNTGSQLAKFLLEAGHTVRVIDERPNVLEKLASEIPAGDDHQRRWKFAYRVGKGGHPKSTGAGGSDGFG